MSWLDKLMGAETAAPVQPAATMEGKPAYLGKPQDTPERVKARLEQLREAVKEAVGEKLVELKAEIARLEAHARHCAAKFAEIIADAEKFEAAAVAKATGKSKGKKGK